MPVELKTQPGITLGNPQTEETGRHYPWLVRLLETVWTLVEFRVYVGLFWEAYDLAREATRLALSMPWVYALDHLYLLVRLAILIGEKVLSEPILALLKRGEPFFDQPPCRSQIGATFLVSDCQEASEKLEKLAHSFRHHDWKRWANEAQTLAEHPLIGFDSVCDPVKLDKKEPFLRARLALVRWQDHLGLPGFLSDDHPLPNPLPW